MRASVLGHLSQMTLLWLYHTLSTQPKVGQRKISWVSALAILRKFFLFWIMILPVIQLVGTLCYHFSEEREEEAIIGFFELWNRRSLHLAIRVLKHYA